MSPVGMTRTRVNTWPKTSSHSAGWTARVSSSVGSWLSLRTSMPAMTKVLLTKRRADWMGLDGWAWVRLAQAASLASGSRCLTVAASGIELVAGKEDEYVVQGLAIAADPVLQVVRRADSHHLAEVHDRHP